MNAQSLKPHPPSISAVRGSCLRAVLVAVALLAVALIWFVNWQRTTYVVSLYPLEGYDLKLINGRSPGPDTTFLHLPNGTNTLIYERDGAKYSYTFNLQGGGDIYLHVGEEDLVPIKTVKGN